MMFTEYVPLAMRTLSGINPLNDKVINELKLHPNIVHAALGLQTEINELKNYEDTTNLLEEAGDLLWFSALLVYTLVNEYNIATYGDFEYQVYEMQYDRLEDYISDLLDSIKKTMFYGKEFNVTELKNLTDKILNSIIPFIIKAVKKNDLLNLLDDNSYNVESLHAFINEAMEKNIEKLKARYGEKFDSEKAVKRNIEQERLALGLY